MIRAVRQRDGEIDDREAERPLLDRVRHARFDRGDVLAWHHAARDLVLEGEALPARQGPDLDHRVAELTVAAGLLLVAAARGGSALDGLAVADLGLGGVDADLEAGGEPLHGDP